MIQRSVKVWQLRRGKPVEKTVRNIVKRNGVDVFRIDQQYAFQVAPFVEGESSTTVIRMIIPKGTSVKQGYQEIRESLRKLGYDPYHVCTEMGFDEVVEDVVHEAIADRQDRPY